MSRPLAIIIGAGPAGLTAALELAERTDIRPLVLEASNRVGGISCTVEHNGNRIDIGGHRFFSKSDRVMNWWLDILPLQHGAGGFDITYQGANRPLAAAEGPDPESEDAVMLVRQRTSRILFRGLLFDYPLSLNFSTLAKLGLVPTLRIGMSYLRATLLPIRPETTLEEFFINRFGRELYNTFFRDYTEKVWGVPCHELPAEWGAQRVKGLSLMGLLWHAVGSLWRRASVAQKGTETSLIERFLYPKFGPGQMWQAVAERLAEKGGEVRFGQRVTGLEHDGDRLVGVTAQDGDGVEQSLAADYVFSSMPVRDLLAAFVPAPPVDVATVGQGLVYRDFITVGLLLRRLDIAGGVSGRDLGRALPDNWIYIQEQGVQLGRLQIFNNWSPYMVADPDTIWLGLEYFCDEGDALWSLDDQAMSELAARELADIGFADPEAVIDSVVIRVPKTYPAYLGSYHRFEEVRRYADGFTNLFLLGRNGMHRYNNQDHSMLTAMTAVDNILAGVSDRENIWSVNAEAEYHEEK